MRAVLDTSVLIAATAAVEGAVLLTHNTADFRVIADLVDARELCAAHGSRMGWAP